MKQVSMVWAKRLLLVLCLVVGGVALVSAQEPNGSPVPPTIIRFASDRDTIPIEDAESGQLNTTLAWETSGMTADHRLVLEALGKRAWSPLLGTENFQLPTSGVYVNVIQNLCGFCPPTYRLSIVDSRSRVLDQQMVIIPWAEPAGVPQITHFSTGVERIDANSVAQRTARITVFWSLDNRVPYSNLIFEQILDSGIIVNVELPRPDLWVASEGLGEVAPVLPQAENYLTLRLRVVNTTNGQTYDEETLIVPIIGAVTAPIVPTVPPQPPTITGSGEIAPSLPPTDDAPPPQIVAFYANTAEVDRGGQVAVTWSVANARSLLISRLNPNGEFADFYLNPPPTGTWTLTLPDYYVDLVVFNLVVLGANETQVSQNLTLRVRCPYTYFFGTDPASGCPLSGETQVEAIYQPFERGFMIWRGDTRQIYVFYNDSGTVSVAPDTYVEGEPITILTQAPEGLYAPARGFGKLWLQSVENMSVLGWASAPELPFTMRVQQSGAYTNARTYFALPDGRILYVMADRWGFLGS